MKRVVEMGHAALKHGPGLGQDPLQRIPLALECFHVGLRRPASIAFDELGINFSLFLAAKKEALARIPSKRPLSAEKSLAT